MHRIGQIVCGDSQEILRELPSGLVQAVIADPPYYNVVRQRWDRQWRQASAYLEWFDGWLTECLRILRDDGLCFVFGQLGRREHVFLHAMSQAVQGAQYHDLIIWDRVVGYSRKDSLDPAYEMVLVLRKSGRTKFIKERVRTPYDKHTQERYLRDKRYTDKEARRRHLEAGKFARNILAVPSLRGSSGEKAGHPTQKPVELIKQLILLSTDAGDIVLDPFIGSGTTAVAAELTGRRWIGIERSSRYCRKAEARLGDVINRRKAVDDNAQPTALASQGTCDPALFNQGGAKAL